VRDLVHKTTSAKPIPARTVPVTTGD
jgi:hypothetical protein